MQVSFFLFVGVLSFLIFCLPGGVFIWVGLRFLKRDKEFNQNAVIVPGVVVDWVERKSPTKELSVNGKSVFFERAHRKGVMSYQAVIAYEFKGERYTVVNSCSSGFKPKIGASARVAVNPQHPADARGYTQLNKWGPMVFIAIGAMIISAGLFALLATIFISVISLFQ